jgi:hypothetical protein
VALAFAGWSTRQHYELYYPPSVSLETHFNNVAFR